MGQVRRPTGAWACARDAPSFLSVVARHSRDLLRLELGEFKPQLRVVAQVVVENVMHFLFGKGPWMFRTDAVAYAVL